MVLSEKKKTTGETPVLRRSSRKPRVASAEKKNNKKAKKAKKATKKKDQPRTETKKNESSPMSKKEEREHQKIRKKSKKKKTAGRIASAEKKNNKKTKAATKKKDEPRTETKKNNESSPMSKEEERKLQKIRQKEKDLDRIIEANKKMMETPDLNAHRSVTSPPDRKRARQEKEEEPAISVGAFVKVSADFSPGVNREEGYGYINEVNLSSVEAATLPTATVKYVLCGTRHRNIPLAALTISDLGAAFAQKRRRTSSRVSASVSKQAQGTDTTSKEVPEVAVASATGYDRY